MKARSSPIGSLVAEQSFDLLGESLTLPEDLSALIEDGDFPSRPSVLPDELRGALLLPSDSGSASSHRTISSLLGNSNSQGTAEPCGSVHSDRSGVYSQPHAQVAAVPPAQSTLSRVEVNCPQETSSNSVSSSQRSNRSKDWSLSDTDLRELLEQDLVVEFESGLAAPLAPVPESRPHSRETPIGIAPGLHPPVDDRDVSSVASPVRSVATGSQDTPSGGSSAPYSLRLQSVATTSASSPASAPSSSSTNRVARLGQPRTEPDASGSTSTPARSSVGTARTQSTMSGSSPPHSSNETSEGTNWSSAMRSSVATASSTWVRAGPAQSAPPQWQNPISEADMLEIECLEASINTASSKSGSKAES